MGHIGHIGHKEHMGVGRFGVGLGSHPVRPIGPICPIGPILRTQTASCIPRPMHCRQTIIDFLRPSKREPWLSETRDGVQLHTNG
jgi:hypothetical protein